MLLSSFLCAAIGLGQTSVLTHDYKIYRQGQNIHETIPKPANVGNPDRFARLFVQPVDGEVYSQPLYVPNVTMALHSLQAGTTHDVVFVATKRDMGYAFDAENRNGRNAAPLWKANMLDPARGAALGATTVPLELPSSQIIQHAEPPAEFRVTQAPLAIKPAQKFVNHCRDTV